jgi:hypothetical protein
MSALKPCPKCGKKEGSSPTAYATARYRRILLGMVMEFASDATDPNLDARVRALINDGMIACYWDASDHYGTGDLVLVYSDDEPDAIEFYPRELLISQPDAPDFMRKSLSEPASNARSVLSESDAAFWLIATFSDEQMACVAVKAKQMGSPGTA